MVTASNNYVSITDQDVVKEEPLKLFSPSNPTPTQTLFLSNIDQTVAFPVKTLFFFESPPGNINGSFTTGNVTQTVKKAVADVLLVPYYFLAGRLSFNHEAKRLELVCNNGGALFVNATSRLAMKDLGDLAQPNPSFSFLVHHPGLYNSLSQTAIFTIQVTRFNCGGFSLGFTMNHAVLDGKAASDMFQSLASICRGESLKATAINNDRTCFRARTPLQIKFPHKEYIKLANTSSLTSSFTPKSRITPSPRIFSEKFVNKLFNFPPHFLSSLKQQAEQVECTTFEVIAAQIWRARTKSVFDSNSEELSTILFAVDVRSKISPPLPDGFAGNAVITAFASEKVKDITENSFSFCVEKVRDGIKRVTDEYARSVIDWLEKHKGIPATGNGNFYLSAWWRLRFSELDFGFGRLVHGGPVFTGSDEFVLLLSDHGNCRGVNVWIGLGEEKMDKFAAHIFDM